MAVKLWSLSGLKEQRLIVMNSFKSDTGWVVSKEALLQVVVVQDSFCFPSYEAAISTYSSVTSELKWHNLEVKG